MLKRIVYMLTTLAILVALTTSGCAENNEPVNTDNAQKTVIVDEGPVIE